MKHKKKQKKIFATIQARMGSTRLPGKVLKKIDGIPLLEYQIKRIKKSKTIDNVIIATTKKKEDDKIINLAKKLNVLYFRGSNKDVLKRITDATKKFKFDINVELISDSPFSDIKIIDKMVKFFLKNKDKYDYVSNGIKMTYPSGMEACIYESKTLINIEKKIKKNNKMREHVECHFTKNKKLRKCNISAPKKYNYPNIFLEVDTPEDFIMVSKIYKYFNKKKILNFYLGDILKFLKKNKQIIEINNKVPRSWKRLKVSTMKNIKNVQF